MCLEPQHPSCWQRVDRNLTPPFGFITMAVTLAMVPAAKGDGKLVADLATERARLHKPQVISVAGAADRTRLLDDVSDVRTIT
jgi:hypothetical protein